MDILIEKKAGSLVLDTENAAYPLYRAVGSWTISYADNIDHHMRALQPPLSSHLRISMKEVDALDTSGAWLLLKQCHLWMQNGVSHEFIDMKPEHQALLSALAVAADRVHGYVTPPRRIQDIFARAHDWFVAGLVDGARLVSLLGALMAALGRQLLHPGQFRFAALVTHIMRTGLTAVPIISLMSFVIGAIIAQQGAYQLSFYGADPMAVDMVAVLVTRDLGVLLTAIMISGRSGSAYTAEIGSMKMREEIDALKVIGLDPVDVLLFPRIAALVIILPLLTVIADYASLLGAQLALWLYIDMSWEIFLQRTRDAVPLAYFMMGIIKAPFMALIIGLIAMSEGLKVEGSSESLSRHTTISVVKSIFMVIVVDGIFAVISASLGY